jgi:hypothetical protein
MFDSISPDHAAVDEKLFWRSLLRGGIQGILYVCDSQKKVSTDSKGDAL